MTGPRRLLFLLARTLRALAAAPLRWRARGWAAFLVVAAGTLGAFAWKRPIQQALHSHGQHALDATARVASAVGGGWPLVAFIAALHLLGWLTRRRSIVDAAMVLTVAGIACWLLTAFGQLSLAEARPRHGGAMTFFHLHGHGVSGHASAAAVLYGPMSGVLARGWPAVARRALAAALAGWIVLVAWSRVWLDEHFLWNVLLGAAVGVWTGLAAVRAWESSQPA